MKTAQVAAKFDGTSAFDRFKLNLLDLQCEMGLDMNPDVFLVISYILIALILLCILMTIISILRCIICWTFFYDLHQKEPLTIGEFTEEKINFEIKKKIKSVVFFS